MSGPRLRGTYTVIVTPFREGGSRVDEEMLRWLVDFQISEGIHGIIALASNGEFLSLSDEERHDVSRIVVEQAAGRVPVVVGTAAESTDDVIRYTRDAEQVGADAAMVLTPYYCWIDEEEIFHHYQRIAEAVSLPIMLYNHPASTVLDMQPPLVARLAEIDNIAYIKESTTDTRRVYRINELCRGKITVFAGYLGYESFMVGAEGWVSVCANIMPRKSARLFELAVDRNDRDGGLGGVPGAEPDHRLPRRPPLRTRHEGGVPDARPGHGRSAPAASPVTRGPAPRAAPYPDGSRPLRAVAAAGGQGGLILRSRAEPGRPPAAPGGRRRVRLTPLAGVATFAGIEPSLAPLGSAARRTVRLPAAGGGVPAGSAGSSSRRDEGRGYGEERHAPP